MFVCPECGGSQPMPGHCGIDGAPVVANSEDALLGQTIGAYRVARLLGIGGMGRVYKGVHPQINSRVAIKVLSRECSDRPDLVERFFAEAKAVNLIRHESIVNVLDLSTLPDGRPYIVMEYLDGAPLAAIIEQAQRSGQGLPLGGIARLCVEVLDALGAAHAKGIVHRDLKPDNIYVTPAGRAKVLDFGIAKLQPEMGGSATHTGSLLGTPHYMSPEQAAGRPVDQRADLYAIGVILFECTTLRRPFSAASLFDLLRMHIEVPPPSPRSLRFDMPVGMEQVILTALAKLPEQRFGSAFAMSTALQHATAQLPGEQWAPILPASSSRGSSVGGWAPTPPASWAGGPGSRPPLHQPTHTSGQVAERMVPPVAPASRSRSGLWLGLGALLLVGGGVTAGVLATRGDGGVPVAPGPGPAPGPMPSREAVAEILAAADAGAAPAVPADPDVDIFGGVLGDIPADQADQLDALAADALAQLPPAALEDLSPDLMPAIKKYGGWSKIPKAERMKLLPQILAGLSGPAHDIAVSAGAVAPPAGPKGSDGWVHYSMVPAPGGRFDPRKLDAQKYLTWAVAEAKKLYPDAVLFRIDVNGVGPGGIADITSIDSGTLDFRFIVPSRTKRDPSKPIGAKQEMHCMFRFSADPDGTKALPMDGWDCKEKLLGPPRCTFAQIWERALAGGAPRNAVAEIGYYESGGVAHWFFTIRDDEHGFSQRYDDDCK